MAKFRIPKAQSLPEYIGLRGRRLSIASGSSKFSDTEVELIYGIIQEEVISSTGSNGWLGEGAGSDSRLFA